MFCRFNTQPPEGGWSYIIQQIRKQIVSTHSRPKAAGVDGFDSQAFRIGFNTQPPEGGWFFALFFRQLLAQRFNTQPPEGGWSEQGCLPIMFSGFNTQPPEGGWN